MKRILHALAALWLEKTGDRSWKTEEDRSWKTEDRSAKTEEDRSTKTEDRRAKTGEDRSRKIEEWGLSHEGLWLPEARNGLLRHLNAMMRMGETVRELATRECTHLPIRESWKEQPSEYANQRISTSAKKSESANLQISSTNQQIDEPTPKNTDNHLPKRVILSEREQPAERIGEPLPIAQVLARVYLRNAPYCTRGSALAEPHSGESATKHESATQPINTPAHHRSPIALTAFIFAVFMCLLSAQQVSAQAEPAAAAAIQPLQIGDTVPENLWHLPLQVVNHPEGKETITLDEYRGKLIILDFWGTYCGSCIAAMPKIAEVQRQFADVMVVIPISWSKPDATEQTLQTHRTLAPLGLSSVVDAKMMIDAFPHGVVPHYAWIDPQGRVVATTATNDVTRDNIAKVLEGEEPDYALAKYIDPDKPLLFAVDDLPNGTELQNYSVLVRGALPGVGSYGRLRKTNGIVNGMAIFNRRLSTMYSMVLWSMLGEHPGKRLIITDPIVDETPYSMDFLVDVEQADSLYSLIIEKLNQNSGLEGKWVKRVQSVLLLTRNGNIPIPESDKVKIHHHDTQVIQIAQYPLKELLKYLNRPNISEGKLVIDKTGHEGLIDVSLEAPFNFQNTRRQLNKLGMDLVETEKEVEVFEIRKPLIREPLAKP